MLTQVFILVLVPLTEVEIEKYLPMVIRRMTSKTTCVVRQGKNPFHRLEVLQAISNLVQGMILELAEAVVSVSMECVH